MRCGWCGRFVRADTQPMVGLNWEPWAQVLCPAHQDDWRYLAAYNVRKTVMKQENQDNLVCVLGRVPEPDETIEDLLVEAIHRVWAVVTEGLVP